jgi:hypothetical protein
MTVFKLIPPLSLILLATGCGRTVCRPGNLICYPCPGEVVTCTYDGVSATSSECECGAKIALYDALCEAGSHATLDDVIEGAVCEPADTGG